MEEPDYEMKNMDYTHYDEYDDDDYSCDETDFGGYEQPYRYKKNNETFIDLSGERIIEIRRKKKYRDADDFFINILDLEPQCSDPEFIDYLLDRDILKINREHIDHRKIDDYSVSYLGGEFHSVNRELANSKIGMLRNGIRDHYDEWYKSKLNKTLKKAGITTAVGLTVIALITGLSVGLTRKGSDIVHQAKKWEKLTPAHRREIIPWTDIEKAGGGALIFTGKYLAVIIAGGLTVYLLVRNKKSASKK